MDELHSLLKRQLKRHVESLLDLPVEYMPLLEAINQAYWQSDDDRKMLERSLELSSQELLQANSNMRAVFQALPDLFFRLDPEGVIVDFNGGREDDYYLDPATLIGKKIQDIPDRAAARKFDVAVRQVRETQNLVLFLQNHLFVKSH